MNVLKSALLTLSFALASTLACAGSPVNVNAADAAALADGLDGVGDTKARAIIEYRDQHGPFKNADELVNVKGIGLRTVEKNRDFIKLADGAEAAVAAAVKPAGSAP